MTGVHLFTLYYKVERLLPMFINGFIIFNEKNWFTNILFLFKFSTFMATTVLRFYRNVVREINHKTINKSIALFQLMRA